jgi:hypothetical protein
VLPAAQAGVRIDDAFIEEVLDDTGDGRSLPLLTDALARLWPVFVKGNVVEVAHEALFTSWPLYSRWLADAEAHLKLSRRLERDAREWAKSAESALYLWTGERLAAAETMLEASGLAADHPARRFLAVSMASDRRTREREANLIAARIEAEHQRLPIASLLAAAAAVDRYGPTPQLERAIRSALVRSERCCVYAVRKVRGEGGVPVIIWRNWTPHLL